MITKSQIQTSVRMGEFNSLNNAAIGGGTILGRGNLLMSGVSVGENCVIGDGNVISHRSRIGDGVWIGDENRISGNVTILPYVIIGDCCFIAGNTVVSENVPDYTCVVHGRHYRNAVALRNRQSYSVS